MNRACLRLAIVTSALAALGLHNALLAQSARPAFKFLPAADAIKLYWSDASNQFKAVRAATPRDIEPMGLT